MFVNATTHPRTIALTSPIPGEGKSTTIANLALTLAQSGSRVCLIEGDLRRPRLLDYLGLEGAAGITDVLIDRATLDDVIQPYGDHGLDIIGAGPIPPNPSELLASDAMSMALAQLSARYDYVLIDTPPVLPVTDAVVLSTKVDGVIVLVGTTIVRKEQLEATLDAIKAVDNNLLGLVLNRVGTNSGDGAATTATTTTSRTRARRPMRRALTSGALAFVAVAEFCHANLPRRSVRWLWAAVDLLIVAASVLVAAFMRYDFDADLALARPVLTLVGVSVVAQLVLGSVIGPYAVGHERGSYEEIADVGKTVIAWTIPLGLVGLFVQSHLTPKPGLHQWRPGDARHVWRALCASYGAHQAGSGRG
ncbi:CpsD/CapB family tyrosine-protein kinase [Janibacter melonis]|uniref:CpsD/CapB family tyrosine-protein kinase n=1 Tax=Janibacter melonis TaxID=262209 RepID=UPI0020955046|nr:CpsD/CapB family tyrosine-protein kinase [Janibacter melonis]